MSRVVKMWRMTVGTHLRVAITRVDEDVGGTSLNDVKVVALVALFDHFVAGLGSHLEHGVENIRELVLLEVLEQHVANHDRPEVLHRVGVLRHHLLLVRLGFVDILPSNALGRGMDVRRQVTFTDDNMPTVVGSDVEGKAKICGSE